MKLTPIILSLAALGFITTAQAELPEPTTTLKEGKCFAEYQGRVYLDGPCTIRLRSDGTFSVSGQNGKPTVSVDNSRDVLGELGILFEEGISNFTSYIATRDGHCWQHDNVARVCVWDDGFLAEQERLHKQYLGQLRAELGDWGDLASRCLLKVGGRVYIDGPCYFAPTEGDGFAIQEFPVKVPGNWPWQATVGADGGFWNNDDGYPAAHRHDNFGGPMHREGACFVNERARVCAWAEK